MRRGQFLLLIQRNIVFRNYLAASTVSFIGSSIFDISMPLYILGRTSSVMALSLVTVSLHLPHFLMAPLTGYSADNFNKRKVMLYSDLGQVVCMIYLLVYEIVGSSSIWPILAVVFLAKSLMLMFETVATFQLIPGLVSAEDLSAANTWFLSLHRLIQILGPFLGGVLMSLFGVRSCILANALSFGATLYFTFKLRNLDEIIDRDLERRDFPPRLTFQNMMRSFADSLKYVWSAPMFRPFIFLMFLWNLSPLTLNSPTLTYYFTATHHFNPAEYGSVVSLFGVMGIIGFLASSFLYQRFDFPRAFSGSCLAQAILAAVAVFFAPFPLILAWFYAASRAAGSVLSMGTYYIRQTKVPKHQIGGINACLRMFFMSAAPISALMQGFIIDRLGVSEALIIGAICLWGAYWYSRAVARSYTPEPEADSARPAA